jgi:integrase
MVDASLGLRASESFGLRWEDFDWKNLRVKFQRSWVYGTVEAVKNRRLRKVIASGLESCGHSSSASGEDAR